MRHRVQRQQPYLLFLVSAIVLMTACREESYHLRDLTSIPRQTVTERTFRALLVLSTDTLAFDWSRVQSARVDDSGNIYVQDTWTQSIVKFDATGHFVGQLGKKGPGPGEFTSITGFDVRGDGTVFVSDAGKVTVFDPEGGFVRKGSNGEVLNRVAVTNTYLASSYFFRNPTFTALSDDLETQFTYGEFDGDPFENSAKLLGSADGISDGIEVDGV